MENTEAEHPWEQKEEDDELEEGLVARRKNLNRTSVSTTFNGDFSSNSVDLADSTKGIDRHHQQQEDEQVKGFIRQSDINVDADEKETQKQQISEYSVYYDVDAGIGKSYMPKDDKANNYQGNGNGMHFVVSKRNGEHEKHEISFEGDTSAPSYINSKTETTDIHEITEYDVETVLKKQDTHDLFCPNCNSCITKRVILRKRKLRIPVLGDDAKPSKLQTPASSKLNVVPDDSSANQTLSGADSSLNNVRPSTSNDYDHQREPDVFRCLSCFAIFMPTGNGFKLLSMFGNKSNEENSEHSQKEEPMNKRWFSNFLRSKKVEHNVTDLYNSGSVQSLDVENNVVGVSSVSSNLNSSIQEANLANGKRATDSTSANTEEQLLRSHHTENQSNSKREYPGMFVVNPSITNNVELEENSISPLQHDGLKLLVPTEVGHLLIDNSQMNQELDVTVQANSPGFDEKGRTNLSFSLRASKYGQQNLGSQANSLGFPINHARKEPEMDKERDVMPEVSQQSVKNNVEIHLEERLNVNKEVLTDKQSDLLEDVKSIERIKGKEVMITVESKQLDESTFQRPLDTLGATETPALQQAVEQGLATATRGGRSLDIIKSIVYGGLIELITSLSVVSSAAGADVVTLNVLALGLANIFGGLFVISHDLWNLKTERTRKREDRYQLLLGQRADFPLHMTVSLSSYLVFGFLPPVVYGFSFHESNDRYQKLLMVAAASIVCIMILAAGKAYIQSPPKSYFKIIGYYVVFGFMVSGVSYLFGGLIVKLLKKIDIVHKGSFENLRMHRASSELAIATF